MKRMIGVSLSILLFIALIIGVFMSFGKSLDDQVLILVNDYPITYKEYEKVLLENRAIVQSYFNNTYEAEYDRDFWISNYDGETPLEVLKDVTLQQLIYRKIEQIAALNYGIADEISYESFLEELDTENMRRKEGIEEGRIIYGPVEFTLEEYYSYVQRDLIVKLKEKMEADMELADSQLILHYEKEKDKLFKKINGVTVKKVSLSFTDDQKTIAYGNMENLYSKINSGEDIEEDKANDSISINQISFDVYNTKFDNPDFVRYFDEIRKLEINQLSPIINEGNKFVFFQLISKTETDYYTYKEVKDSVIKSYIETYYESFIDAKVGEAVVIKDEELYKKITVDV